MSDKHEINLTPFEIAKINIKKTAENFNLYNSIEMLAFAMEKIEELSEEEREALDKMFVNVLLDMSSFLEEKGHKWN